MGKRIVFEDDEDDDVKEMAGNSAANRGDGKMSMMERVVCKKKEYHKDAKLKSWRLILRNLPFRTTREDLQNACSAFGSFTDIVLPMSKKIPGKVAGFAFIQFKARESAVKAREFFNHHKFKGRMVAADWALPKDTYETAAREERELLEGKVKMEKEGDPKKEKAKVPSTAKKHDCNRVVSPNKKELVGEETSDEEVSDVISKNEDGHDVKMEINEQDDDESDEEDEPKRADSAVSEQRVVFLRNLSFGTTNETLKTEMEKFGRVELAICCKFRDSGHPKGTAFVHFSSPEEAKACIAATVNGLEIDGRDVKGSIAIQRENAAEIQKRKSIKILSRAHASRSIEFQA
ncbi:RRM domain-containing protein [Trichostrongylus colubriformis]|uniref:RRM domain-containing protein n=1 Tax=Trichostrongylus colubriformis TaxID=6319 RepID=A0AAN8FIF1_TRICO